MASTSTSTSTSTSVKHRCAFTGCRKMTLAEFCAVHDGAPSSLQDKLGIDPTGADGAPKNGASVGSINPATNVNILAFVNVVNQLGALIQAQHGNFIAWFAARGELILKGLNLKFLACMTKEARKLARTDGLNAMNAMALASFDRAIESEPKLDRWIAHAILVRGFPRAVGIKSVNGADHLATLFTRIDPPRLPNMPEEYELKRGLDPKQVEAYIDRAILESWSAEVIKSGLDTLWGADLIPVPSKAATVDPVKAARDLVASIFDKIKEEKIDVEAFMDEFQIQCETFHYALVKGRTGNGAETLKMVRTGKPPVSDKDAKAAKKAAKDAAQAAKQAASAGA